MSHRSKLTRLTALATAGFLAAASLVALSCPASAAVCAGTAPLDFNGDGISDAAIGTFNVVEAGNRGVHIIYGTRQGLIADASGTALDDQRLTMTADSTTGFGAALATGDFNRDGCSDLAVGDPFALDAGHSAGVVWLYYGSVAGLPATGLLLDRSLAGATNVADGDTFGETLAVGDFNGDGRSDLAVGAQNAAPGGEVYVFPGNSIVSPLLGAKRFAEGDGTVPGMAQANDSVRRRARGRRLQR